MPIRRGAFRQVEDQIRYVTDRDKIDGPKRVLIIGASNGYGLAARIVSTFASGAATVGVAYERPAKGKRTASAGWYNNEAFTALAQRSRASGLEHQRRRLFQRDQSRGRRNAFARIWGRSISWSTASPRRAAWIRRRANSILP